VPQDTCRRHNKFASYRCQSCGSPICDRCTFNARFCSRACNENYSGFVKGYERPRRRLGGGLAKVFFVLLLAAATMAGLWWAKTHGMI
jgi:hypothetical protein